MVIEKQLDAIFKAYDIRGIYGTELTDEIAYDFGRAFGTFLREKGEHFAVVGMDNRLSSPLIKMHLVKGLCSTGIDVFDIGTVITPIFYYATELYEIKGGVMITASHNPAEYNGFKVQYDGGTIFGETLTHLKERIEAGRFLRGKGSVTELSPVESYYEMILEKIKLGPRKLKVVVDPANGTASLFAETLLQRLGCEVIPINNISDASFPNHFPDPTRLANLQDLIKTVQKEKADVGIGYDGDGDRIGVVSEKGEVIYGDMLMILYWREILRKHPGAEAIVEVKCSDVLVQEIKKLGGQPFFYKTGHSLIKAKMKEIGAIFTGEMSGHMFFADEYYGFDDALYATARLLRILSNTDEPFSALLADVPTTYPTPELHAIVAEAEKKAYVKKTTQMLEEVAKEVITVDGVRATFEDGWGLVRASNTGPSLVVRAEGTSKAARDRIYHIIETALFPLVIE